MNSCANAKNTLVILPTYNEKDNITKIVTAIRDLNLGISILIIDDNSPDGSGVIADETAKTDSDNIFVLHRERKLGLGTAYIEGFKFAIKNKFAYVCEMDADFSHDPKNLVDFVNTIKDCDMVIGSRYKNGVSIVNWPFRRLVLSFFANKFVRFITGMPFTDCTGGFKCIRTCVFEKIALDGIMANGYGFQAEMLFRIYREDYAIKEIPIIFVNRKAGQSKMGRNEIFSSCFNVIYSVFLLRIKDLFKVRSQENSKVL